MSNFTSRWYRDADDLERMLRLVTASAQRDGIAFGHLHVGDVIWGLFPNLTIDPAERIHLFEDDAGTLRGFVWLYPPREFSVQVDTSLPNAADTARRMLSWVESHLAPEVPLAPQVSSLDVDLHGVLRAAGYRPTGAAEYRLNAQAFGDAIPEAVLPEGAAVRPVRLDDPSEVEARVELHREVWEPSKFTGEGYARLRTMPVYRPDLDLVAVTPSGELASYCIVWWDAETRTGLFEPVGTSTRFRRQGYGRALILCALRRLREIGAEHAVVVSELAPDSEPARRLYEATGFTPALTFDAWEREPGS